MKLICVSGNSGVGKTTFAKLLQSLFPDSIILSGDDLHRWERNDPKWDIFTHLDPQANRLDLGYDHICALMKGDSVWRHLYNHSTGKFDPAIEIHPKNLIIYEGLHALYDQKITVCESNLNIFIDTEDRLKNEWKIKRDTKSRGYTKEKVLETIQRRKVDEQKYIVPQMQNADVLVKFSENEHGKVELNYILKSDNGKLVMEELKALYDRKQRFLELCQKVSLNYNLHQGSGGNISIKDGNRLYITSSGKPLKNIHMFSGYCECDLTKIKLNGVSEEDYMRILEESKVIRSDERPSMETGLHTLFPEKWVLHTHPIHVNALLCSMYPNGIISTICGTHDHNYVYYVSPGLSLFENLQFLSNKGRLSNVVFLANHGLIVAGKTPEDVYRKTEQIDDACKDWLEKNIETFVDSDSSETGFLFPDAALFPEQNQAVNNHILGLIKSVNLVPRFLTKKEIESLTKMPYEQYRKSLK